MDYKDRRYADFALFFRELAIKHEGEDYKVADLALKLAPNQPTMSKVLNGMALPSASMIDNIKRVWGEDIRPQVLAAKEKRRTAHITYDQENEGLIVEEEVMEPVPEDVSGGIPLIPTYAIAGYLSGEDCQINLWECERYIIPMFRKASFLIRVNGDSMQPRYFSGDLLACAKVPLNDIWFDYGSVYVVDTKQGALVKVIKKGDDSDHITLVSFNPEYEPYQLHKRELNGVAKVIGLIRAE